MRCRTSSGRTIPSARGRTFLWPHGDGIGRRPYLPLTLRRAAPRPVLCSGGASMHPHNHGGEGIAPTRHVRRHRGHPDDGPRAHHSGTRKQRRRLRTTASSTASDYGSDMRPRARMRDRGGVRPPGGRGVHGQRAGKPLHLPEAPRRPLPRRRSRLRLVMQMRPAPYRLAAPVQREVAILDGRTRVPRGRARRLGRLGVRRLRA